MGNRVLKYLSVFALLSIFVLGGLVIVAHFLVTPERIRDAVVPVLEQKLQRKVHLAGVEVSLFSGVTLNHLAVVDSNDDTLLVSADKVVMRYQLWPLLLQRVVIDEVRIERPKLNVERRAGGQWNLTFLPQPAPTPKVQTASLIPSAGETGIDLLVSDLYISQGEVIFKDYTFGTPAHIYKLSQFDLRLGNVSFDRESSIVLWGKFNGSPVDIEGKFALGAQTFDLELVTDGLDLIPLQPYYRHYLNGRLDGLVLDAELRVHGGLTAPVQVSGQLVARDLDLVLNNLKSWPLQGRRIDFDVDLGLDAAHQRLDVAALNVDVNGIELQAQGAVTGLDQQPVVDLKVTTPQWSLRRLVQELPRSLSRDMAGYDPAGTVDGEWVVQGPVSLGKGLLKQGRLELSAVQLSVDKWRPRFDGRLDVTDQVLDSQDLAIALGDNRLSVTLHSDDWQRTMPRFTMQLRSELFDATPQSSGTSVRIAEASSGLDASGDGAPAVYRKQHEPGPVQLPMVINGDVAIEHLKWNNMRVDGLRGQFALDQNILRVNTLVGRLASGTFRCDGQIDLNRQGFVYQGHGEARDIDLNDFVAQVQPEKQGALFGSAGLDMDFKGAGTQSLRIQQNLAGTGDFTIVDGRMEGTALMKQLAALLVLPEFSVFSFQQGSGSFTLHTGGQLDYVSQFSGSRSRLKSQGTVQLTKEIASTLDVYLAPALVEKLNPGDSVRKYMVSQDGWGRVPLTISGRYDRPQLSYNMTVVGQKASEVVTRKLQEKLQKHTGDETAEPLVKPAADLLNSALKELLGPVKE